MHDLGLHVPDQTTQRYGVGRRGQRTDCHRGRLQYRESIDLIAVSEIRKHLDAIRLEFGNVALDDTVLTRRLRGPIAIVNDNHPHPTGPSVDSTGADGTTEGLAGRDLRERRKRRQTVRHRVGAGPRREQGTDAERGGLQPTLTIPDRKS